MDQDQSLMLAANFTVDILGEVDTRPDTWGRAGYQVWPMTFTNVPDGHRVHISYVSGDLVAWFRNPTDKKGGALFGLQSTAPEGSTHATPAADNCFVYIQTPVGNEGARAAIDNPVTFTLEADNILYVKVASFLNETEQPMHLEPTFVLTYNYVPA